MQIQFCNHPHPLVPCKLETTPCCNVCIQGITQLPPYGCTQCKYFLHKSCAELQQNLQQPFHPQHPLILLPDSSTEDWCAACCKSFTGGCSTYKCKECAFYLCVDCIFTAPNLKWEGHKHPLALIKAYHGYTYCGFCNSPCCNGESVLHCVPCDFTVHPRCIAELPQTIKLHHGHRLFLNDCLVEDSTEDLYCDLCEKLRTSNQLVYSCKECDYVADLYCVIKEILPTIIINNENGRACSDCEDTLDDPALDEIDKEMSTLRDHSRELAKRLEDLNIRAKELNQETENVNKEIGKLEEKRAQRVELICKKKDSKHSKACGSAFLN